MTTGAISGIDCLDIDVLVQFFYGLSDHTNNAAIAPHREKPHGSR